MKKLIGQLLWLLVLVCAEDSEQGSAGGCHCSVSGRELFIQST
jgi:hypothetical protein